jgi:histidinol phosphatase-like PHP family hydrolase
MGVSPGGMGAGEGLGRHDLHVHTTMSDGDLSLAEVVAIAQELDVIVGIADHISTRNLSLFISNHDRLREYLDALDGAPVVRGGEFCWCDPLASDLPAELAERFDYRIGSNHGFALPDGTFGSPWWSSLPAAWRERPDELMDIMVRSLCEMVRVMPIDIAAHSTLLPPALTALEPDVHAWWTEAREDRFVDAIVASGVALEISNRYRLPHDRILRKAKAAGATFSLGSDAHHEEQVARLDWAVEAASRAGVTGADLFVPRRLAG